MEKTEETGLFFNTCTTSFKQLDNLFGKFFNDWKSPANRSNPYYCKVSGAHLEALANAQQSLLSNYRDPVTDSFGKKISNAFFLHFNLNYRSKNRPCGHFQTLKDVIEMGSAHTFLSEEELKSLRSKNNFYVNFDTLEENHACFMFQLVDKIYSRLYMPCHGMLRDFNIGKLVNALDFSKVNVFWYMNFILPLEIIGAIKLHTKLNLVEINTSLPPQIMQWCNYVTRLPCSSDKDLTKLENLFFFLSGGVLYESYNRGHGDYFYRYFREPVALKDVVTLKFNTEFINMKPQTEVGFRYDNVSRIFTKTKD